MSRPKRLKSNVDLVQDIMERSQFGALAQMFVIDAITKLADRVAASDPIEHALISGEAWKGVAIEIKEKMNAFYSRSGR